MQGQGQLLTGKYAQRVEALNAVVGSPQVVVLPGISFPAAAVVPWPLPSNPIQLVDGDRNLLLPLDALGPHLAHPAGASDLLRSSSHLTFTSPSSTMFDRAHLRV